MLADRDARHGNGQHHANAEHQDVGHVRRPCIPVRVPERKARDEQGQAQPAQGEAHAATESEVGGERHQDEQRPRLTRGVKHRRRGEQS